MPARVGMCAVRAAPACGKAAGGWWVASGGRWRRPLEVSLQGRVCQVEVLWPLLLVLRGVLLLLASLLLLSALAALCGLDR